MPTRPRSAAGHRPSSKSLRVVVRPHARGRPRRPFIAAVAGEPRRCTAAGRWRRRRPRALRRATSRSFAGPQPRNPARATHAGFLVLRRDDHALGGGRRSLSARSSAAGFQSAVSRLLRVRAARRRRLHGSDGRRAWLLGLDVAFRLRKLHRVEVNIEATQGRCSIALARARRVRARGLRPALREDRRPLARPRALGDAGRGLARAAPKGAGGAKACRMTSAGRDAARKLLASALLPALTASPKLMAALVVGERPMYLVHAESRSVRAPDRHAFRAYRASARGLRRRPRRHVRRQGETARAPHDTRAHRPRSAIMIGDRSHDIRAARMNGARGIGVLWGYGTREELAARTPSSPRRRIWSPGWGAARLGGEREPRVTRQVSDSRDAANAPRGSPPARRPQGFRRRGGACTGRCTPSYRRRP